MTRRANPSRYRVAVADVQAGDFVKCPREPSPHITGLVCWGVVQVRQGDWVRVPLEYGSRQTGAWIGKVDRLEEAYRDRKGNDDGTDAQNCVDAERG